MLSQNDVLLHVTQELEYREPDWEKVIERYFLKNKIERQGIEKDPLGVYLSSVLSEIHLRVSLEDICLGLESNVQFDPIDDSDTTTNYNFRHINDSIIISGNDGQTVTELDELVIMDGLPVIFEVKLSIYKESRSLEATARRKMSFSELGSISLFRPKYYMRKLNPVMEYFSTSECGYVVIIDPIQIKPHSPVQQEFISQGGIIVPFYKPRMEYRTQVAELAQSRGITINQGI